MRVWLSAILGVLHASCGGASSSEPDTSVATDSFAETETEAPVGDTEVTDTAPPDLADDDGDTGDDADNADDPGEDDAEAPLTAADLFDPDRLLEIEISMAEDDWDALRRQTRSLFDVLGPGCLDQPPEKVFTYFPGDVTVDGVTVANAGVRKKGFLGSLDDVRPSLRIEFDELVDDQRLLGIERLTLNNGHQDPSRVKQCLAYETFDAAGVPAPRCNFVHLTVNGSDLGLYVHVEEVKRAFLRRRFDDATGEVWEGQLSDFREGWLATFEPDFDDDADTAPLTAVIDALAAPDDALLARLDQVIDLDGFMSFWATEGLIGHWDGYAGNNNNFFVYFEPAAARLHFMPWGTDQVFIDRPSGGELPTSVLAVGVIARRLYAHPEGRARYHAELRRLLDEVWDEARMMDRIAGWDALTRQARIPDSLIEASKDLARVTSFVERRRAAIEAELVDPPDWPLGLRDPPCARPLGPAVGELETTWGTLAIEDIFSTGSGILDLDIEPLEGIHLGAAGVKAGEDPVNAPGRAQIIVAAPMVGGAIAVVFETELPIAPGRLVLDHVVTAGFAYWLEAGGDDPSFIGMLGDGALELEAAAATSGAELRGSFEATLFAIF